MVLTLSWRLRVAVLFGVLEGERDAQELHVAVAVPHQQLLAGLNVLAGLVEDLALHLHGDQVLLVRETSALHQRHPVAGASSAVDKVAQLAIFKHLNEKIHWRFVIPFKKGRIKRLVFIGNGGKTHYLPHQSVVVVSFNLAGVDQFALEGPEARSSGDATLVGEDPAVRHVSPGRVKDAESWR